MENIKFIDITQLPEDLWQDAKNLIAIDSNGEVIKAEKQDSYSKDEIDDLLKDAEISADKLQNKIKINSASTDYVVTQPTVSGDSLVITDSISDKNQYHTFGYDKTITTTSHKLLDYSTPLFRGTNEYNCPQWDGNSIRFTHLSGMNFVTRLTIPYTYNGVKYVTHFDIDIKSSMYQLNFGVINDPNFQGYQSVKFKESEVYKAFGANETFVFKTNNTIKDYAVLSPDSTYDFIFSSMNIEMSIGNFPLTASNGALIIETPRFYLYSNNVLMGDVPTVSQTYDHPEHLSDYIRYSNDVKAYILTDKNTKFKTINGEQITGDGNITIETNVDLSGYATEQWVNEQGFLKEHQDISNLATKSELATKQDVISDLETIRSGAAKGATALQSVPSEYAKKTDILSAKTDTRYTTFDVQNPVLSGKTILLQNEVTDSRKYHTLGFDKTVETTEIGDVRKYVDFNREFDSSGDPIIRTNFDNYENIPLDFSNITDDGDVDIIYFYGSFVNFENGTEGAQFNSHITYNKNTKILKAIDNERITSNQFKRSDTGEYIFDTSQMQFDCNQLQNGAYLIWSIYVSPGLYYRFNASTSGKLFVGETTTTSPTSRFPQRKNEFFRYENGVKSYILTDKNTTFKTINGQQITGNGDITIDTNVDLSGYATEQWVNTQGFLKEHQDISNLATKSELATKQDTLVSGTNIKTINGTSLLGSGDITIEGGSGNVDLTDYYTKSETNALVNPKLSQVTLTQAEYDALQTKENNVLYVISDAEDIKFKTINGAQITGEGNIEVATKSELNAKQDVISDLDTIRSGAAKGATALQSVPSGYATEQWVNSQGFLKEHQDISNLATKQELNTKQDVITDLQTIRNGAALGATALQSVPSTYALKSEIKTVNGISLIGSGNIEIAKEWIGTQAQYDALSTKDNNTTYYITE